MNKSKQEIESAVTEAMSRFLEKHMGEIVHEVTTLVIRDTIFINFTETLPPAERYLAKENEGGKLLVELKNKLMERAKPLLGAMIRELTGAGVVNANLNLESSRSTCVFVLDRDLEKVCQV